MARHDIRRGKRRPVTHIAEGAYTVRGSSGEFDRCVCLDRFPSSNCGMKRRGFAMAEARYALRDAKIRADRLPAGLKANSIRLKNHATRPAGT